MFPFYSYYILGFTCCGVHFTALNGLGFSAPFLSKKLYTGTLKNHMANAVIFRAEHGVVHLFPL